LRQNATNRDVTSKPHDCNLAALGITRAMLSRILNGAAAISADMDVRLSKALGTSPGHWLALQSDYDLWQAQKKFKARIRRIAVPSLPKVANG
jgi:plasmid maintenance system antidote protein VapI